MKTVLASSILLLGMMTFLMPFSHRPSHAEELQLETVTVTAQKKEEDVSKIPMAISAFSELQIEDAGVDNTIELMRFSPNVFMKKSTIENIVLIRGITSFESSVHSPTAFYVDDVNLPFNYMHNVSLFDVERVEILKGPQGSLYGRNNEAGVVNIITKQPDDSFGGKVLVEPGKYSGVDSSSLKAGFRLNLPLIENELALGLYAQSEESKGYMENEYNDDDEAGKIDHKSYRANLRWRPNENWDISLIGDSVKFDDKIGYYRFITGSQKTDRFKISHDQDEYSTDDGQGVALRIKYNAGSFDILSVTGHRSYRNENLQDADVYSDPMNDYGGTESVYANKHLSQEIRLISPETSTDLKWLIGIYAFTDKNDILLENETTIERRDTEVEINGNALFAQATFPLSERLDLTAGIRFDSQFQTGKQEYDASGSAGTYDKELSNQEVLPKLAISYAINEDVMVYTLISKGYMSGGYNYSSATSENSFHFKPEYTVNKEIGMKSSWLENRLALNATIFHIDITDKQVSQVAGDMSAIIIENAARAYANGIELELAARLSEELDLMMGYGRLEAKYLEYEASEYTDDYMSVEINDYKDKHIANVPQSTYNVGLQYRHGSGFTGRLDVLGTGKAHVDSANTAEMDPYNLVNFRVGYESESFDVFLWGKNIFDQEYQTVQYYWGTDLIGQDGEPAHFGASLVYRFKSNS